MSEKENDEIEMSTNTTCAADFDPAEKRAGFFRRALEAVIAARQAEACRQVAGFLANQSDARLKDLGFTDAQIREVRQQGRPPVSYWS
jgi:uncharacterized protein YjiS (DUF1127 family)